MSRIRRDDGSWVHESKHVRATFENYFKGPFQMSGSRNWGAILDSINKVITNNMNQELLRTISIDEVKEAAFQMGGSKTSGSNGL